MVTMTMSLSFSITGNGDEGDGYEDEDGDDEGGEDDDDGGGLFCPFFPWFCLYLLNKLSKRTALALKLKPVDFFPCTLL